VATGSATAKSRGESGSRRGGGRSRGKASAKAAWFVSRWWKVALLVALATIGLPIAHAIFGEVVALLGLCVLLGFLLGRWTAR
jgi:hypothetical protein